MMETALIWTCSGHGNIGIATIIKLLLEVDDIDVNIRDKNGKSAFTWACKNKEVEIVRLLLKVKNIDVNLLGNDGKTALMHACGNVEITKLFGSLKF